MSPRLHFWPMGDGDLELMHSLLGDPVVMAHYDRPKTVEECQRWIGWNKHNYDREAFGLWIIETDDGDFVGDCDLTWQPVDGESLGYHVKPHFQGRAWPPRRRGRPRIWRAAGGSISSSRLSPRRTLRRPVSRRRPA